MQIKFIDLFCGAGGVTSGIDNATFNGSKCAEVIACVNHDPMAIISHKANHPDCVHFTEDIKTLDVHKLPNKSQLDEDDIMILWASLECTNFSNAKGGLPRDADSRTLAEHLYRYIDWITPDYILIENVREFMSWGPLDENGKPVSKKNGRDYMRWMYSICDMGYNYDFRLLNAADFGAHTSRIRYFGCFAKKGLPIVYPEPTHDKHERHGLKKWRPVKEVLNFDLEGESIFTRKKPLSEKTLARIYAGLVKYVGNGDDSYIIKYMGNDQKTGINNGKSIHEPSLTLNTQGRIGLVQAKKAFISKYFSGDPVSKNISVDGPAGTVKTKDSQALVQAAFISKYYGGNDHFRNKSIDDPAGVIRTANSHSLVRPCFLVNYNHSSDHNSVHEVAPTLVTKDKLAFVAAYYGNGDNVSSVESPAPTLSTKDRLAIVESQFWIDKQFTSGTKDQSIDQPSGAILPTDKHRIVEAESWVMNTSFNNVGSDLQSPAPVITANRKQFYLVNPQWGINKGSSIETPAPTIIARMDKAPPYLVSTEDGVLAIEVMEADSDIMVKIKYFMAAHGIIDIKMRMLVEKELLMIQGFIKEYFDIVRKVNPKITQTQVKKYIGNAVPPIVPQRWVEALYQRLLLEVEKLEMIA